MKRILYLLIINLAFSFRIYSQELVERRIETLRGQEVICPGIVHDHFSIIEARESVKGARSTDNVKKSQIIVNYVNFSAQAKEAFQRAIDIWETLVYSPVPIRVTANWEPLASNILGSANTTNWLMNFKGARYANTYYPIALAEKLAGEPLNSDDQPDIICRFNSTVNWHFGAANEITSGKFDLTSIVLHEIGHGLGFISTMTVADQFGYYGEDGFGKSVYDIFLEDAAGTRLLDTASYQHNTIKLKNALTSDNLFFGEYFENQKPKVYAPTTYQSGSSISHLDDNTYPSGSINSLMTSSARSARVIHDPGPLGLGIFYKMGWKTTSVVHERIKNLSSVRPVEFKVKVLSDYGLESNSARLIYQANGEVKSAPLQRSGNDNEYATVVNFPPNTTEVLYYFEMKDLSGETITSPGTNGVNTRQYVYSFEFGNDRLPPLVDHSPLSIEEVSNPIHFLTFIEDDYDEALQKAQVRYQVNGGNFQTVNLEKYNEALHGKAFSQGNNNSVFYLALNAISNLKVGDVVNYQIVATDAAGNTTVLPMEYTSTSATAKPSESYYTFTVTNLLQFVGKYATDFENAENDFAKIGMRIVQENGFNSKAMHSSHPYKNGLGALEPGTNSVFKPFEREEIAMLRYPIFLGEGSSPSISYDEVVLIEPGENGSNFGDDDFYDFVVLEGSLDGVNWYPVVDGYDSRDNAVWRNEFMNNMSGGDYPNSTFTGRQSLYKRRTINLNSSNFAGIRGVPALFRFRLYSDQLSNGWGWAIDNLYIQENAPVILANENENTSLKLYPNPSVDYLDIETHVSKPQTVLVEVFAIDGGKVYQEKVPVASNVFTHRIQTANYGAGTYLVRIKEEKGEVYKRFIKI